MTARLFVVLLAWCPALLPCSCIARPTAKEAWRDSQLVFAGRVETVSSEPELWEKEQTASVIVEEAFKGVKAGEKVTLLQPGHMCAPKLGAGQRVVLYLHPSPQPDTWEARSCHRSRAYEDATSDLAFLRALPDSATHDRITIVARQYVSSSNRGFHRQGPAAGTRVLLRSGSHAFEGLTDGQGYFELLDPPRGDYDIQLVTPKGIVARVHRATGSPAKSGALTFATGQDLELAVDLLPDNEISGRLLDPDGAPRPAVRISLVPPNGQANPDFSLIRTNREGRFRFLDVPAGEYLLVINEDGSPSAESPYPLTYYPGVTNRSEATSIKIADGQHADGLVFKIPALLPRITISGKVLMQDGRPAPLGHIWLTSSSGPATLQSDGSFTLPALANHPVELKAVLFTYRLAAVGCEALAKRFLAAGQFEIYSNEVSLTPADADQGGIVLTIPLPSCQPNPGPRPDALKP